MLINMGKLLVPNMKEFVQNLSRHLGTVQAITDIVLVGFFGDALGLVVGVPIM